MTTIEMENANVERQGHTKPSLHTVDWSEIGSILQQQLFFPINDETQQRAKLEQAFSTHCSDSNNKSIYHLYVCRNIKYSFYVAYLQFIHINKQSTLINFAMIYVKHIKIERIQN